MIGSQTHSDVCGGGAGDENGNFNHNQSSQTDFLEGLTCHNLGQPRQVEGNSAKSQANVPVTATVPGPEAFLYSPEDREIVGESDVEIPEPVSDVAVAAEEFPQVPVPVLPSSGAKKTLLNLGTPFMFTTERLFQNSSSSSSSEEEPNNYMEPTEPTGRIESHRRILEKKKRNTTNLNLLPQPIEVYQKIENCQEDSSQFQSRSQSENG